MFGGSSVGSTGTLSLSALTTSDGFRLDGAASGDYAGRAVSGAGDVNGDATVSQADILAVIDAWGTNNSYMDIDQDGTVGILDLLMLLEYWGDCP